MARIARVVIPGVAHHITQRGNNAQDVFLVDDDRGVYLELLKQQSDKYGLEVVGEIGDRHLFFAVPLYHLEELLGLSYNNGGKTRDAARTPVVLDARKLSCSLCRPTKKDADTHEK